MNHAKEPWFISKGIFVDGCIITSESRTGMVEICKIESAYLDDEEKNDFEEEQISNAKRIVTCINACAGLTHEQLEEGCIQSIIKQRDDLLNIY